MLDNPKPGKNMEEILKEERKKKEQNKKTAPYRTGSISKKYPTKFLVGILLFLLYSYLNL